jgi:hypothetical protein
MVIFGAGASFDADPEPVGAARRVPRIRLPLAKDLFDVGFGEFAVMYSAVGPLLRRLRAGAPYVEQELEKIRREADADRPDLARQLAAVRYYIRALILSQEKKYLADSPDEVTNYTDFLQDIEDWRARANERVLLVTFNYDTLLDRACYSVLGWKLDAIDSYIGGGNYLYIKLHGSVNWDDEVELPRVVEYLGDNELQRANSMIDLTARLVASGRIAMLRDRLTGKWGPPRPAISVPMVSKTGDDFACPTNHIAMLAASTSTVTDLIIVGWRGAEGHFHELWRKSTSSKSQLRRVLIVDVHDEAAENVRRTVGEGLNLSSGVTVEMATEGFKVFTQLSRVRAFLQA